MVQWKALDQGFPLHYLRASSINVETIGGATCAPVGLIVLFTFFKRSRDRKT